MQNGGNDKRTVMTEALVNFQPDTGTHRTLLQSIAYIQFLSITHQLQPNNTEHKLKLSVFLYEKNYYVFKTIKIIMVFYLRN